METEVKDNSVNYTILPTHKAKGHIYSGYDSLATALSAESLYILDGYIGVDWQEIIEGLGVAFRKSAINVRFIAFETALKETSQIEAMVQPFLGADDPLFGYRTDLSITDFYDLEKVKMLVPAHAEGLTILYGTGAACYNTKAPIAYFDLPKNILSQRMRQGQVDNLGADFQDDKKQIYKRFYFVDWVVLNKHKKNILPRTTIMADQQLTERISWMYGKDLRDTLKDMSTSFFRVRPWFEPGVWGGQWMKKHMKQLDQNVENYAWSFEMIVPENGLVLADGDHLLEVSFDQLMYIAGEQVLGKAHNRFGDEFPIRFDFLDTFDGGNLSIQCHPGTQYAKDQFGENFTQDETYYIVDCEENAEVYLGFQQDIQPDNFRKALEESFENGTAIEIEKYVQKFTAQKHDLYLIPNGTVHASGKNNLVLEISATPYIFTFKMYDWVRPDLDGKPRPLNIARAFENLDFSRKGTVVQDTLISKPKETALDVNTNYIDLPTHEQHFYTICRYDFTDQVSVETKGQCHILMLVEGSAIELTTTDGKQEVFHFVETFAVPAAAGSYRLRNLGEAQAKVIVSFVKDEAC
ncbi:class I mannose-6-phosphate isomerase [Sphingobacterium spiritivorum]|uniref:class I mannose-6-phosphate isomerase n=1 Tax=Sphingobacterium spiritivorum TaxID=258 RepID=UPI003DA4852D